MVQNIDIARCNAEKKYAGDLRFEFEADPRLVDIPYVSFSSSVRAELRYEILEDDSVEVTGKLFFRLKGLCSRCLKEAERAYTGEVDGYFVPNGDGKEDYSYRNGVVVLDELLRDSLAFSLPAAFLCNDMCSVPEYEEV